METIFALPMTGGFPLQMTVMMTFDDFVALASVWTDNGNAIGWELHKVHVTSLISELLLSAKYL